MSEENCEKTYQGTMPGKSLSFQSIKREAFNRENRKTCWAKGNGGGGVIRGALQRAKSPGKKERLEEICQRQGRGRTSDHKTKKERSSKHKGANEAKERREQKLRKERA